MNWLKDLRVNGQFGIANHSANSLVLTFCFRREAREGIEKDRQGLQMLGFCEKILFLVAGSSLSHGSVLAKNFAG